MYYCHRHTHTFALMIACTDTHAHNACISTPLSSMRASWRQYLGRRWRRHLRCPPRLKPPQSPLHKACQLSCYVKRATGMILPNMQFSHILNVWYKSTVYPYTCLVFPQKCCYQDDNIAWYILLLLKLSIHCKCQ